MKCWFRTSVQVRLWSDCKCRRVCSRRHGRELAYFQSVLLRLVAMIVRARFRIDLSGIFESSTPNVSMDASLNKTMSVEISLNKTNSMDVSLNKSISSDLDFLEGDRSERSVFGESSVQVGSDEVVQKPVTLTMPWLQRTLSLKPPLGLKKLLTTILTGWQTCRKISTMLSFRPARKLLRLQLQLIRK